MLSEPSGACPPGRLWCDNRVREEHDHPKLGFRAWLRVLWRLVRGTGQDDLTDRAAGLTYYAVLSIVPFVVGFFSLLGFIGDSVTDPLRENVRDFAPGPGRDLADQVLDSLEENQGGAGVFTFVGLGVALYSGSEYIGAYARAANAAYDIGEGRPFWKTVPLRFAVALLMTVLLALTATAVLVTGGLADRVGELFGFGETAVLVWEIAKWPVVLLLVTVMLTILNTTMPNVAQPRWRWITPGSVFATGVWAVVSAGFAVYVANFGSYDRTYGTLGGAVILLIWLWLTNIAVLLGLRLNAEIERQRAILVGKPVGEPFVTPREEPR